MGDPLQTLGNLIEADRFHITRYAVRRVIERSLDIDEIVEGVRRGKIVEDYEQTRGLPQYLVLQVMRDGSPVHVLWEIEGESFENAWAKIVTAYEPDPSRWSPDFLRRLT